MTIQELLYTQQLAAAKRFQQTQTPPPSADAELGIEAHVAVDSTDRVETRRALVHPFDGLGLERIFGDTNLLTINYLEFGLRAARPVCRIQIRQTDGRNIGFGTGFMISPTLLLTNHHVLASADVAINSLAEFNFEDDLSFLPKPSSLFRLDPSRFFYNHHELDFALVAVHPRSLNNTPLTDYGFLPLIKDSGKALKDEPVSIIQHPSGADKQIALRDNRVIGINNEFIHYETDTLPGSSGSPVFNDQWQVVALHHAGVPKRNKKGQVLTKDGRVWQPIMGEEQIAWLANEGVRVSAIFQHLLAKQDWRAQELQLLRQIESLSKTTDTGFVTPIIGVPSAPTPTTSVTHPPITVDEFHALVDHESTTEADLAPYLVLDPQLSTAFNPVFKFNRSLVIDPTGLESDAALPFFNQIARNLRQRQYRRKVAANPNAIKICAEGDSWFQFPLLLTDIIDHLMERDDMAVFCLSAAGDHLRTMINQAEFIEPIQQERPEFFLISGGGNDMVGGERLAQMVNSFAQGRPPEEYLNQSFTQFEQEYRQDYRRLFRLLATRFPNLKILCHGYDYVIPRGGLWLSDPLASKGITDDVLQRNIVRVIMDRMNRTLKQVAEEFVNVTYLDLRGIVAANDWFDELHPQSRPFGDLANIFANAIHSRHMP